MKNNKKILVLILALIFVLQGLVGCQMNPNTAPPTAAPSPTATIPANAEEDAKTVIATVNGVDILKGDFIAQFTWAAYSYGYDINDTSTESESLKQSLMEEVYETLIGIEICRQQAEKAGYWPLSEEDRAQVIKDLDEVSKEDIDAVVETIKDKHQGKTDEEIREIAVEEFYSSFGYSYDRMLADRMLDYALSKYQDNFWKDINVSDDKVLEHYNTIKAEQYESFNGNYTVFETAVEEGADENGNPICYYLPNYVRVQSLLIGMSEEDSAALDELWAQEELDEEAYAAKIQEGLANIEQKAKDILKKVNKSGSNFEELIAEYGEDPGMATEEKRKEGYLVGKGSGTWVKEFVDGAMTLNKVGETTGLIGSEYGYFIIKLIEKIPSGYIPLLQIKNEVKAPLLQDAREEKWDAHYEELQNAAQVVRYEDRLVLYAFAE